MQDSNRNVGPYECTDMPMLFTDVQLKML